MPRDLPWVARLVLGLLGCDIYSYNELARRGWFPASRLPDGRVALDGFGFWVLVGPDWLRPACGVARWAREPWISKVICEEMLDQAEARGIDWPFTAWGLHIKLQGACP